MKHYLMHTEMGKAQIFSTEKVILEAKKVLEDVDFGDYTKDRLIAEFVQLMNAAFCTGKLGSTKEPSVQDIRNIVAVAYILDKACGTNSNEVTA